MSPVHRRAIGIGRQRETALVGNIAFADWGLMLSSRPPRSPNYAGFRRRGIPLVHQLGVAGPFRRQGVATLLIDAAEKLARDRDIATLGITVGLFDEYGTAQRLYGRRGYIPTAGAHARASYRSAKGCGSPSRRPWSCG